MAVPQYSLNHVAVSVPSVEDAAAWYLDNFGFTRLRDDALFSRNEDPNNIIFKIYPPSLNIVKVAYLVTGDGTGLELFEFIDPPYRGPSSVTRSGHPEFTAQCFTRGGFFHIAFTADDVDALCQKVVSNGGRKIGDTVALGRDRALYLMDPWGNVIELLTRRFIDIVQ